MSNAKKCDRCGKYFDAFPNISDLVGDWKKYSIHKDCHPYEEIKIDLCMECRKMLFKWLKENKE